MRRQIDIRRTEFLDDQEEPICFVQLGDFSFEVEFVKDVSGTG